MKKIITLITFILLTTMVFSYSYSDLKGEGYLGIELDKKEFSDEITGRLILTNPTDKVISNISAILHLINGEQVPDRKKDNILFEKTLEGMYVLPGEVKKVLFSIPNKGGNRIDVYAWNGRVSFSGLSTILYNPEYENFINKKNTNSILKINREMTMLNDKALTDDVFVKPSEKLTGKVVVNNLTSKKLNNLELIIEECKWNVFNCNTKEKVSFSLNPKEEGEVLFEINAPETPSAYTINYKVKSEKTESVYKSRVIVEGKVAPVRKIIYNGIKGEKTIDVLVTNSPDKKNIINEGEISLSLLLNGKKVKEENKKFTLESFDSIGGAKFSADTEFDALCVDSKINKKIKDSYCFDFPLNEILKDNEEKNPEIVKTNVDYKKTTQTLNVNLEKENINVRIMILKNEEIIFDEDIKGTGQIEKNYFIEDKPSTIVIDDKDAKKQIVVDFALDEYAKPTETINGNIQENCKGQLCENGMVCSGEKYISLEGECCLGECIPLIKEEKTPENLVPLAMGIAIIIFIGAVIIFITTTKKE